MDQRASYSISMANEAESEATTEIERYMAIPGQTLSYKIGQLKIMELRQRAQDKMGVSLTSENFMSLNQA
jgi:uncharacterized protein (DUF885 family)